MLNAYILKDKSLTPASIDEAAADLDKLVWVDLDHPTRDEELAVETLLNASVPTREEMSEIELSNRLYFEKGNLYATASIVTPTANHELEIHAVSFVIIGRYLVTIRYSSPVAFLNFIRELPKSDILYHDGPMLLLGLQEAIVNRVADVLEVTSHNIDTVTRALFKPTLYTNTQSSKNTDFNKVLQDIGLYGDLISKTRESLISVTRLLGFISQAAPFKSDLDNAAKVQIVQRDIQALNEHANFLDTRISFLLDATLGMIGTKQNDVMQIFSIAAVILMPPTLIAGIYGMNFHFMPELDWRYGYPAALLLMLLSGLLPYRYFKKRGWL